MFNIKEILNFTAHIDNFDAFGDRTIFAKKQIILYNINIIEVFV